MSYLRNSVWANIWGDHNQGECFPNWVLQQKKTPKHVFCISATNILYLMHARPFWSDPVDRNNRRERVLQLTQSQIMKAFKPAPWMNLEAHWHTIQPTELLCYARQITGTIYNACCCILRQLSFQMLSKGSPTCSALQYSRREVTCDSEQGPLVQRWVQSHINTWEVSGKDNQATEVRTPRNQQSYY